MSHREDEDPLLSHPDTPDGTTTITPTAASSVGCCGQVCGVVKGITVEPVLFTYVFSMVMMVSVTTNLLLDKECEEVGFDEEVCANLTAHPEEEAVVQQAVTTTRMYLSFITSLPAVIFALFLGSWSDRHGRKVPLVMPLIGQFISTVIFVANVLWMALPSAYILITAVPVALTGGLSTLLMASFSYISDITKVKTRTTRIAFVDLGFSFGSPLGLLLGEALYYKVGYWGVYGGGAALFIIGIFYVVVRIKDTRGSTAQGNGVAGAGGGVGPMSEGQSARTMCVDLFDTENVRLSFATTFKRRPHSGRAKVLALIVAMCLMVTELGGNSIDFLYLKRVFGWTYSQYVHLTVTQLLLNVVGASMILPILSYRLQVPDPILVLAGCVSRVSALVVFALAPEPWFLYMSCGISVIGGFPFIISRSLISKIVPPDELGRVFSVLASAEAVIPLASHPIYTAIYNYTLTFLPCAIYFLGAALYTTAGLIVLFIFFTGPSSSTSSTTTTIDASTNTPPIRHIHADEIPDLVDA